MKPTTSPKLPPVLGHGARRWAIIGGAVLLVLVLAVWTLPRPSNGPRVVTDASFVAAANAHCKATLSALRPPFTGDDNKKPTPEQVAQSIDSVAGSLDRLAGELRALPVAPADQAHVAAWLGAWNRYTDIGRQYANAVRAGDHDAELRVTKDGDATQRTADRFARANGIDKCQFHAVPQGGSDPFSGGM